MAQGCLAVSPAMVAFLSLGEILIPAEYQQPALLLFAVQPWSGCSGGPAAMGRMPGRPVTLRTMPFGVACPCQTCITKSSDKDRHSYRECKERSLFIVLPPVFLFSALEVQTLWSRADDRQRLYLYILGSWKPNAPDIRLVREQVLVAELHVSRNQLEQADEDQDISCPGV